MRIISQDCMIESKAFQNSLAAWECMQFKTNTEACREGRCISWLLLPHTPHLELSASKAQAHFPRTLLEVELVHISPQATYTCMHQAIMVILYNYDPIRSCAADCMKCLLHTYIGRQWQIATYYMHVYYTTSVFIVTALSSVLVWNCIYHTSW